MRRLRKLEKTTEACPAQWEGETAEGEWVYVRYRWGELSVEIAPTEEEWNHDDRYGERYMVYRETVGGNLDGVMETDRLLGLTGMEVGMDPPSSD